MATRLHRISCTCLVLLAFSANGEPLTLVANGRSDYVIYFDPNATGELARAALEVQRVVKASTGVQLPIVHEPAGTMVSLGDNAAARAAGIDVGRMAPESFRIRTSGGSVFIAGPDTDAPATIHDAASRSTLYGAYTFLEKHLGVRWLMPGDLGEDIPSHTQITLPKIDMTQVATFKKRTLSYAQERTHSSVREWMLRSKLGQSLYLAVGHSWDDHPPQKTVMQHPEWWPEHGGKRRIPEAGREYHQKYCTSNQDYVRAFAASMADRLNAWDKAGYGRKMASASPADGSGWCECEACKAGWEPTENHPMLGAKLYRHSLTPVVLKFYQDIRRELKALRPDAWVGGFVYAAYTYPPRDAAALGDRIFLVLAPRVNYGLTMYRPEYRDKFEPLVRGWRQLTPHLGYYAVDTWMRSILGTPLPASRPILRHMYPILKKHGVQAVLHYGLSAWGYGAAHNYLVARLMWDADADVDTVYEEFFRRAYGKGAGPMMEIYDLLERELARFEQKERGFNYDMTTEIVMDVYQPNYWTIEKLYRQAYASAETGKQRGRLETFSDNMRVLHFVLADASLLDFPERSCFHIPLDEYPAFWKRASATCYVTPQPKRDVGYITRLFVPQRRQLTIPRVPANVPVPVIDGLSNDPAWGLAASGKDLRPVGSNQPAKLATPFRVVYGDDALYLTFRCVEPNQDAIIVAGATRDDASIYTGDTFELFFGCVENRRKHWHITVNPANLQWDAWEGNPERNTSWQSAVTRDASGWGGEIRIPFTVFNLDAPPTGKHWHVNIGREDKPSRENSTWSNVENSFLEPHNFGTWTFGE